MKTKTSRPQLAEECTQKFVQKKFTIGVLQPLNKANQADLFFKHAEALCHLGFSFSVLAVGDQGSQEACFALSQKFPTQFELLESIPSNRLKVLEKSQIAWFTKAPEKEVIKQLAKKGVVPVMPYDDTLVEFASFDVQQEQGNCFLYDASNQWEALATIIRAYENFKFPYDWGNLRKHLKKVFEA